MAVAAVVIAAALYGLVAWWEAVDADHRSNRIYGPTRVTAGVRESGDRRILRLGLDDREVHRHGPLVPDQGKRVHVFRLRTESIRAHGSGPRGRSPSLTNSRARGATGSGSR